MPADPREDRGRCRRAGRRRSTPSPCSAVPARRDSARRTTPPPNPGAPGLLSGYEVLKAREAKIPAQAKPRLTEALERLVQLYDAWGKPDEAAAWRKRLEELKTKQNEPKDSPKH